MFCLVFYLVLIEGPNAMPALCAKKKKKKAIVWDDAEVLSVIPCMHEPHAMQSLAICFSKTSRHSFRHHSMPVSERTWPSRNPSQAMQHCCPCISRTPALETNATCESAFQNSQSSSTDLIAQSNFSRNVLEKNFSMGTSNFLEKTTVRRGSM